MARLEVSCLACLPLVFCIGPLKNLCKLVWIKFHEPYLTVLICFGVDCDCLESPHMITNHWDTIQCSFSWQFLHRFTRSIQGAIYWATDKATTRLDWRCLLEMCFWCTLPRSSSISMRTRIIQSFQSRKTTGMLQLEMTVHKPLTSLAASQFTYWALCMQICGHGTCC